jgi:KDO2-lipid IV(A) lauroyltransferase
MLLALRRGEFVGFLGDQDAGQAGVFVDFLGRPASVFRGAAYLAWRLRYPIIVGLCWREADGFHRLEVHPPLEPDPALDEESAVLDLTRRHVALLEQTVRRRPEFYYWIHRRWKTQPPARHERADGSGDPLAESGGT